MSSEAKFRFSMGEGVLELEGSEDFVSKHIGDLKHIIESISAKNYENVSQGERFPQDSEPSETIIKDLPDQSKAENAGSTTSENLSSHPRVYSEIGGKLKISTTIPGDTLKGQMTNAALIHCYGRELMGQEQVADKDIRQICIDHGILDKGNFAKIFGKKDIFVTDGVRKGCKQVKLTFKGKMAAKQLIEKIENE